MLSYSVKHIDTMITMKEEICWRFSGFYRNPVTFRFYRNPVTSQRGESWKLLRRLTSCSSLPWLVGDDFNDVLRVDEKEGGTGIISQGVG